MEQSGKTIQEIIIEEEKQIEIERKEIQLKKVEKMQDQIIELEKKYALALVFIEKIRQAMGRQTVDSLPYLHMAASGGLQIFDSMIKYFHFGKTTNTW